MTKLGQNQARLLTDAELAEVVAFLSDQGVEKGVAHFLNSEIFTAKTSSNEIVPLTKKALREKLYRIHDKIESGQVIKSEMPLAGHAQDIELQVKSFMDKHIASGLGVTYAMVSDGFNSAIKSLNLSMNELGPRQTLNMEYYVRRFLRENQQYQINMSHKNKYRTKHKIIHAVTPSEFNGCSVNDDDDESINADQSRSKFLFRTLSPEYHPAISREPTSPPATSVRKRKSHHTACSAHHPTHTNTEISDNDDPIVLYTCQKQVDIVEDDLTYQLSVAIDPVLTLRTQHQKKKLKNKHVVQPIISPYTTEATLAQIADLANTLGTSFIHGDMNVEG